jgi:ribose transport system substrate-binding protein
VLRARAVDQVILLELPIAGALPASRLVGTLVGLREILPGIEDSQVVHLDGNGQFGPSLEATRKHLRQCRAGRTLISAINDHSTLGALRAFEEAGRAQDCAVVGQNASYEARCELRRPGTRLLGSVAFFPERYGEGLISLALDILSRKPVPPAVFIKHQLITAEKVDHYYPNDVLLSQADLHTLLLRSP